MKKITQYKDIQALLASGKAFLLYASATGCSVCLSDAPKVQALVEKENFPAYTFEINQLPQAAGQLSLMSAPAVLLFYQGKEWHRQARILDFDELEYRIKELGEVNL